MLCLPTRTLLHTCRSRLKESSRLQQTRVVALYSTMAVPDARFKQAAKAAILGGLVADAAATPLHWIYDVPALADKLRTAGATDTPEFFEPPSCPFYQYPTGALSPYGDEIVPLLQSVAANGGLDGAKATQACYEFFKTYPDKDAGILSDKPKGYAGRLNHVAKELIANLEKGATFPNASADDSQAHCLLVAALAVGRYSGTPEFQDKVRDAVLIKQNNPTALSIGWAAAQIVEQVVKGASPQEAVEWAAQEGNLDPDVQKLVLGALALKDRPHTEAVDALGKSCALPGSFQGPIHAVATSSSYVEAVRKTIVAGGDNCSRVGLVGAIFGAAEGSNAIPAAWKSKTHNYGTIEALVDQILAQRG
ncbi:hypothetical protein WJX72_005338 [[Myrmecia] bisecta]|uniref:Uncharacterized protein n=1 Tax=[Myrmecia] bisecta TaxID=41462 RepID=A0AAW1PYG9_9CHLO